MNQDQTPGSRQGENCEPARSDEEDEALVAYLDGELTQEQATSVESQLKSRPDLREKLKQFELAWKLLDEIPDEPLSPHLTQSTMELVALSLDRELALGHRKYRTRTALALLLASVVVFVIGFAVVRSWEAYADRVVLADLQIIADWPALKNIDSMEWLDALVSVAELETVAEYHRAMAAPAQRRFAATMPIPQDLDDRRKWAETLNPQTAALLADDLQEFRRFRRDRQDQIRSIAARIYQSNTVEKYLTTARAYAVVLANILPNVRDLLVDPNLTIDQRLEQLQEALDLKMANVYAVNIPDEDRSSLSSWLNRMKQKYGSSRIVFVLLENEGIASEDILELIGSLSNQAAEILERLDDTRALVALVDWLNIVDTATTNIAVSNEDPHKRFQQMVRDKLLAPEDQERIEYYSPQRARSWLDEKEQGLH